MSSYHNLTDTELVNVPTSTDLEAELSKRLADNTEEEWEELQDKVKLLSRDAADWRDHSEKLENALQLVAKELERYALVGLIQLSPEFRESCAQCIAMIDGLVSYERAIPMNNTSSFRAGGEA